MNAGDFKRAMTELEDFYGEKAFPPRVTNIIWRIVEPLTFAEFTRVVEAVLEESSRTPNVAAVKKAALPFIRAAEQRRQQDRLEQLESLGKTCQLCGHSGYIVALLRSDPRAEFSFRCPACPAAKVRRLSQTICEWNDDLKGVYIPVSLRIESYEAATKLQREVHAKYAPKKPEARIEVVNGELAAMGAVLLASVGVTP